jgi:hypothetical protein
MTNIEQAKRLKEAGITQGKSSRLYVEYEHGGKIHFMERCRSEYEDGLCRGIREKAIADIYDELEMMNWLATGRKIEVRKYYEKWCVEIDNNGDTFKHHNLTEALVQACEAVLKENKKEGRG